jgi:hypothetical protein
VAYSFKELSKVGTMFTVAAALAMYMAFINRAMLSFALKYSITARYISKKN